MRVIVTGGAGFVGSHLCDALIARGDPVICLDNLATGRMENIEHLIDHPLFRFSECDVSVTVDVDGPVDAIVHLASAASPPDYQRLPLETLAVGSGKRRTRSASPRQRKRGFFSPQQARYTVTQRCIRRPKTTGETSTPSGPEAFTMRRRGSPRR